MRILPATLGGLRSGSAASSSAVTNRQTTGRSWKMTWLAASSTCGGLLGGQAVQGQVDGDHLVAQMEAHGLGAQQLLECLREDVLAGVLLHVVQAAGPVHAAGDGRHPSRGPASTWSTAPSSSRSWVSITATPFRSPLVARLSAGFRVEAGAVQHYGRVLATVSRSTTLAANSV